MKLPKNPKTWIVFGVLAFVVLSFILNDSFRLAISRKLAIRRAHHELNDVGEDLKKAQARLNALQQDSTTYEVLVRSELGYLKPGEREIRFLKKT